MTFWATGVAGCASTPRFACIRPNSSKVDAFISSWIAFGCNGSVDFLAWPRSVLNPNVTVSFTRTTPSHEVVVVPVALQLLLAANDEP